MAPTSDERREVARKLREDLPVARNVQEGYVAIMQTIGVRPCLLMVDGQSGDRFDVTAYEEGAARLADLIDPTCEVADCGHHDRHLLTTACLSCHASAYRATAAGMRACMTCRMRVDRDGDEMR